MIYDATKQENDNYCLVSNKKYIHVIGVNFISKNLHIHNL